jgi:hypothetical protein
MTVMCDRIKRAMTLPKTLHGPLGWIAVLILLVLMLATAYSLMPSKNGISAVSREEASIIRGAITQQAMHERDSVANVQSRSAVTVRRSPSYKCIDLHNKDINVYSTYCYKAHEGEWKLVSELVGTQ